MAAAALLAACGGGDAKSGGPSPTAQAIGLDELKSCLKDAGLQVTATGTVAQDGEEPISYLEVAVRKHRTAEGTVYDKVILSVFDSPAAATTWLEAAPPIGEVSGMQPTQHGNVLKSVSNSTLVAKDRPPPPDEDAAIDGCIAPE